MLYTKSAHKTGDEESVGCCIRFLCTVVVVVRLVTLLYQHIRMNNAVEGTKRTM